MGGSSLYSLLHLYTPTVGTVIRQSSPATRPSATSPSPASHSLQVAGLQMQEKQDNKKSQKKGPSAL